ncbi:LuxR C-terminal-related transcriptional regulator [Rhizobium binxianense]
MHHDLSQDGADIRIAAWGDAPLPQRFRPPRMLFNAIERPFLLSKIRDGLARQIVVVHAPAGYGKTALLRAGYAAIREGSPYFDDIFDGAVGHCGWLTVVAGQDETALTADLAAALGISPSKTPSSLSQIIDIVTVRRAGTILFLDELDASASPGVADLFNTLLLTAPDNLRIVCATKSRPKLPLARLGVRGVMMEITAQDLAFTRSEIRSLLGRNAGAPDVDAFWRNSRGWPALGQLARIVIDTGDSHERRAIFEGTHDRLLAYVEEAVLGCLPPALRRALRVCCITEEFSPDLAIRLSGTDFRPDDIQMLDNFYPVLEKSQTGAGWYRLHPVLRACLESELVLEPQIDQRTLHSNAAIWFTERGFLEKAVSHAARGGNFPLAAETIRQAGGVNLFIRAGHTVLEHLMRDLPAAVIYDSPGLLLCYVLVLAKKGNLKAARECMNSMKDGRKRGDKEFLKIEATTLSHIDGLVDVYEDVHMDDADIARLERMAAGFSPQSTWELGWIHNHLCIAYTRRGDLDLARLSALKALAYYREEKTIYSQIFMLIHLGLVNTLAGNFSAALSFCCEARDLIQSAQWTDLNLDAICRVAMADILYLQGDMDLVDKTLGEAVTPIIRGEGWVDIYTRLFSLLARARLKLTGMDAALAAIDKAEEVAIERFLPRLGIAANIMRLDIFTKTGLIEPAALLSERLVVSLGERRAQDCWTWREESDFLLARVRLLTLQKRPAEALALLEAVKKKSRSNGSGYHLLAAKILATRAAWDDGRHAQALEYFQAAIARARSHEATQLFADEGPEFAAIVRAIIRRFGLKIFSADAVDFISRVIGQGVRPGRLSRVSRSNEHLSDQATAGVGLLSHREQEVLLQLHEGKSNKEIARSLDLSEATVKFHLKNIFMKLGVSRRAMALAVSTRLNLH